MGWEPKAGHFTQLRKNADGSVTGANDCFEACLARALKEWKPQQYLNMSDEALLQDTSEAARGAGDYEDNPPTDIPECERAFAHYGMDARWTTSYVEAEQAQMAICLVNGVILAPSQYPSSWFGGENYPDHFILWLPYYQGQANWFNDPLNQNYKDNTYDLGSVAQAFGGAFLLPAVPGQVATNPRVKFTEKCALNSLPSHDPLKKTILARIPAGATGIDWGGRTVVNGEVWERVQYRNLSGYVVRKVLAPVS